MSIRVGVVGAAGRMGSEACRAIASADDLDLVAAVSPSHAGAALADLTGVGEGVTVAGDRGALADAEVDVALDLSVPEAVAENTIWSLQHGIHAVVGATGASDEDLERIGELARSGAANAFFAPNFAVGAVLMMRYAAEAARFLPDVEIIELHHAGKVDAPSGTAIRTADLVADARGRASDPVLGESIAGARGADRAGVRIHSVRLPGLMAHQEVILGGTGQTLSIRHDAVDRASFMPGVLLAIRRVGQLDGLVVGLEHLLD